MIELFSVSDVLSLLLPGLAAGFGLGSIFWLLGFVVSGLVHLIDKNT